MTKTNWYRFDNNGVKYICLTDIDKFPEPLIQEGYTTWHRGKGPITELPKNNSHKLYKKKAKNGKPKKNLQIKKQQMDTR